MSIRLPAEIGADLRTFMAREGLSESELVIKILNKNNGLKLTQSWLSRIAAGKFRRLTPTVKAVAAYANIPVSDESQPDPQGIKIIDRAVADVWNGSVSQATVIARLIRVAEVIPVIGQSQKRR